MRIKLKFENLIKDLGFVFGIVIVAFLVFKFVIPHHQIQFQNDCQIEINSLVDYTQFIKNVKNGKIEDVKIDSSKVNTKKLGDYTVTYQYKNEKRTLTVSVVDTTPPQFDIVKQKVALNQTIDPQHLVKNIKDETQTTVSFKEDYKFDKVGEKTIQVVVEDEGHNQTEKSVEVEVVEDKSAPEMTIQRTMIVKGDKNGLESLVQVSDSVDLDPQLEIKQDNFDINKIGTYNVTFIAKDASGNENRKNEEIKVISEEDEKVVYLTFDDGPSQNTAKVLEILNQYNCKASFFITGMDEPYRKYIKIAHDQGHTIGLHTYTHKYSKVYASVDAYFDDLDKVGAVAKEYLGYVPKYIRFPGGSSNTISRKYKKGIMSELTKKVEEKGYIYYDWNAENGDGFSNISKKEMLRRATLCDDTKIMLLMHDAGAKKATVEILPEVIEYYQKKGYVFKAIDDSSFVPHQHVNN